MRFIFVAFLQCTTRWMVLPILRMNSTLHNSRAQSLFISWNIMLQFTESVHHIGFNIDISSGIGEIGVQWGVKMDGIERIATFLDLLVVLCQCRNGLYYPDRLA